EGTSMTCRPKLFKVGDVVRVGLCRVHPLPSGLKPGMSVKVVADLGHSYYQVEHDGKLFTLYTVNLDNGMQFEVGGRWLDSDHPLLAAVRRGEERRARPHRAHHLAVLSSPAEPAAPTGT